MVASQLVDSPLPSPKSTTEELPERLFAAGHEPVGVRVNTYQKSSTISAILNALKEDEIEFLKNSPFGKFVSLAGVPTFSGRFGRFLISRQLKTKKKHEAWFLFAGSPVRFSLREFAIVTGLPCGKFPKKSKKRMRKNISEKPYWPSLFGKLDSVTVASVIKMLKKKTVTDRDTRIKYACLALLASVLLPTCHHPKISKEHAELIIDIDDFFAYPWGRLSFDMLMSSIKERDEISLSQNSVSVSGFALSLQLVLTAAVPALTEVVQEKCTDSSESDEEASGDEEEVDSSRITISLNPGHARDLDTLSTTHVHSIIDDDPDVEVDAASLVWSDEEDDPKVDTLVNLIDVGHRFNKHMFTGGARKADVNRMREEAKAKKAAEKQATRKKKATPTVVPQPEVDAMEVSSLVFEKMRGDFMKIENEVSELKSALLQFQLSVQTEINEKIELAKHSIISSIKMWLQENIVHYQARATCRVSANEFHTTGRGRPEVERNTCSPNQPQTNMEGVEDIIASVVANVEIENQPCPEVPSANGMESDIPSFSLGMTQEEQESQRKVEGGGGQVDGVDGENAIDELQIGGVDKMSEMDYDTPSFSLDMTQKERESQQKNSVDGQRDGVDGASVIGEFSVGGGGDKMSQFVSEEPSMGNQVDNKFTWVIKNLSSLQFKNVYSDLFVLGGCKWRLLAYPKGDKVDYFSLFLEVADHRSLPSGWRIHAQFRLSILNQISETLSQRQEKKKWFDQKSPVWGHSKMLPLAKLHAKDGGFMMNGEVKITAEIDVLKVIGKSEETRHNKTQQLNGSVDVNGFLVLPSQVESVKLIFERHPDIASGVHTKSPHLRTTYINNLLGLIQTLCLSPEELSDDDLNEASAAMSYAVNTGFKLDWLVEKLNQVLEKKNKVQSGESRLPEMEEELLKLDKKRSDLKASWEKEKAKIAAAKIHLSFDDVV